MFLFCIIRLERDHLSCCGDSSNISEKHLSSHQKIY
jgi:hypothetical protein